MTIHYSEESLNELFNSVNFTTELNNYHLQHKTEYNTLTLFLDTININKNYHRLNIRVKHNKYKKNISKETAFIKKIKESLNKISSINSETIYTSILNDINLHKHLYPLIIDEIFEQSLLQHSYIKYYAVIISKLHANFDNKELISRTIDKFKHKISINETNDTAYLELCSKNNNIDKLIGYSLLITELETMNVISGYIQTNIDNLLDSLSKEISEDKLYQGVLCLQNIFNVLYPSIELDKTYIDKLVLIKDSMKYMKIKFKIMDILERR